MTAVLRAEGLDKAYGRGHSRVALEGLDLTVDEGSITGLLGPNGAGKTTAIRIMLGLVRPDGGTCRVLGVEPWTQMRRVADRVGAIHEIPRFYPYFTARQNLELLATLRSLPQGRIDSVLEACGLTEAANTEFRAFSLGMKQRLGIGSVLLKDSEILILDEPANGLDPAGIVEIRRLLRSLVAEGKTVLMATHVLAEVEMICDSAVIIHQGKAVAQGSIEALRGTFGEGELVVHTSANRKALALLGEAGYEGVLDGDRIRLSWSGSESRQKLARLLREAAIDITEIREEGRSLEDIFLRLTREEGAI